MNARNNDNEFWIASAHRLMIFLALLLVSFILLQIRDEIHDQKLTVTVVGGKVSQKSGGQK